MENQAESPASTVPPEVISHQSSITAQNSGVAVVPQVIGCQIGGSLNINLGAHTSGFANTRHQQTSAGGSITASRISASVTERLKCSLRRKFETIFEGIAKRGNPTVLNKIYTELYITEGETGGLNMEHEVWQIDQAFNAPPERDRPISCNDIFKPLNIRNHERETSEQKNSVQSEDGKRRPPRTVVTKGIAGIGKTVSVQKFILDWAEGKANQDIDLLLVLPFRELNSVRDKKHSLHELLLDFYSELRTFVDTNSYHDCKILFIFDGLDESQLPLNFGWTDRVSDVSKPASLDELMTNLIDGNLLPSALVWITSRPAAIDKVPPHLIHRMTEVRGFTDLQKEEYFRKRVSNPNLASRIISHVKESRSLEIMCHIPVFCWITATVLEQMLKGGHENIPSSLTELYTRFLLIQTSEKKKKYCGMRENDPLKVSEEDVQLVLKLGKLAFDNLQKHNIVFSEDDLKEYEVNVTEASLRSGVFTEVVQEEDPMFSEKKYSFVHLSFQEYLAAIFVVHQFADRGENAMQSTKTKRRTAFHAESYDQYDYSSDRNFSDDSDDDFHFPKEVPQRISLHDLQKCAIDKALRSISGHLDLFLRFLLGLSMESNQKLLKSFSVGVESGKVSVQQTVQYLKGKLRGESDRDTPSSERCINLLQCLLELNDHSMVEEIRRFLTSDRQAEQKLTAAQCSTLAYIILMSGEVLEELDLKKYNTSEEGRRRLVPAVRNCRKAVISDCNLMGKCFETVGFALQNANAHLRELDISKNALDKGALTSLLDGLNSPCCRLDSLNLSHINLEKTGAAFLRAILMGPHIQPHTLKVSSCSLTDDCADCLISACWSSQCRLRELDLSYNTLSADAVKRVLQGLLSPYCDLQILRLSGLSIGRDSCVLLASVLRHSFLRELILDSSNIGNIGAKTLCGGLMSPYCQLQRLGLRDCKLSKNVCFYLTVAFSTYSVVRELNLGDNDLQDPGVKLLSAGLKNPNCILQNLGLSGCMITKDGCSSLASALKSNPAHLRELDLSYNHPGRSGEKLLRARLEDPHCRLKTVKLIHGGPSRLAAGLWKYYHELTIGYVPRDVEASSDQKGVIRLQEPEFFSFDSDEEKEEPVKWTTVHCREELTGGRFYWELEWTGLVSVGVSENKLFNGQCLELNILQYMYPFIAMHSNLGRTKSIAAVSRVVTRHNSQRTGVLLDWPAGTVSFYSISCQGVSRLHTFHTEFTKPMFATFKLHLPYAMENIPSIAIATWSPESVHQTKAQLYAHFRNSIDQQRDLRGGLNFLWKTHFCDCGSSLPSGLQTAIRLKKKRMFYQSFEEEPERKCSPGYNKGKASTFLNQTVAAEFNMADPPKRPADSQLPTIVASNGASVIAPQLVGSRIEGSVSYNIQAHYHGEKKTPSCPGLSAANQKQVREVQAEFKENVQRKFGIILEGIARKSNMDLFEWIDPPLYISEAESEAEEEVWKADGDKAISCNDVFTPLPGQEEPSLVLTKGIAGIGKTVCVQKFVLDWATGKHHQDVEFMFVLPFMELNSVKDDQHSLHTLLSHFHPELKVLDPKIYKHCKVAFILDGLEESKLDLELQRAKSKAKSKTRKETTVTSVNTLISNLISRELSGSALVWITSWPERANQLSGHVDRVTALRGFSDAQKEEYFRKKIRAQDQAQRIISHVKSTWTIYTMCDYPIFCWITATALERAYDDCVGSDFPKTLSEILTWYLIRGQASKTSRLSEADVELFNALGEMAFKYPTVDSQQLTERDFQEHGLDLGEATRLSELLGHIFIEVNPSSSLSFRSYRFLHSSIQAYLAAISVLRSQTYNVWRLDTPDFLWYQKSEATSDTDSSENEGRETWVGGQHEETLYAHFREAVNTMISAFSTNKHLKQHTFLPILLGLSLNSGQMLLSQLIGDSKQDKASIQKTTRYIRYLLKSKKKQLTHDQSINLLRCLAELKDYSFEEEMQTYMLSGSSAEGRLSAAQCSVLALLIQVSGTVLDELDVLKLCASSTGQQRLASVVRYCRKARLSPFQAMAAFSALESANSHLEKLEFSNGWFMENHQLLEALRAPGFRLKELHFTDVTHFLSHFIQSKRTTNDEAWAEVIRAALLGPHGQPYAFTISNCSLKNYSCEALASALQSTSSGLKELDLSYNDLTDSGIQKVYLKLEHSKCELEKLRLSSCCKITEKSCTTLAKVLHRSHLRELHLDGCSIGDTGIQLLARGLTHPNQLQILQLGYCGLTGGSCEALASALSSDWSVLRELDLSSNDLGDSGVTLLSNGLRNPHCKLQTLRLSGCMITEDGCSSLASALDSNPSHLRELDLSYNHPGESGQKLLSAKLEDPDCKLETLRLKNCGEHRIKSGLFKYGSCFGKLKIASPEDVKKWANHLVQSGFADEQEKFYWQVEWKTNIDFGMKYKSSKNSCYSFNQYWLETQAGSTHEALRSVGRSADSTPQRVGIYLDWPAGTLSFYRVLSDQDQHQITKSDKLIYLHTLKHRFRKPLYPYVKLQNERCNVVSVQSLTPR
ncbi:uncharacterized protein [Salminus brasiliensis]|uniref:uncharacterized protein n=1 Tax=Salminus brasiliensis TaxID=930266 RepID=UPI003B830C6E